MVNITISAGTHPSSAQKSDTKSLEKVVEIFLLINLEKALRISNSNLPTAVYVFFAFSVLLLLFLR